MKTKIPASLFLKVCVLGSLGIYYLIYSQLGFGNDNDTYHMLETWRTLLEHGQYVPSRGTGYPFPELAIGVLSHIGGHQLSNMASIFLSISILGIIWSLSTKFLTPQLTALVVVAIGINPTWVIMSATSMDHIYALSFWFLGLFFSTKHRWIVAGTMFSFCAASRFSYIPIAALPLLAPLFWNTWKHKENRITHYTAIALFLSLTLAAYLPSFQYYGGLGFITVNSRSIEPLRNAGNWLHGNMQIWGLMGIILWIVVLAIVSKNISKARGLSFDNEQENILIGIFVAYHLVLYYFFPLEWAYLLPTVIGIIYICALWCVRLAHHKSLAVGVLLAIIITEIINSTILATLFHLPVSARPKTIDTTLWKSGYSVHGRSISGQIEFGLFLADGIILRDLTARKYVQEEYTTKYNTGVYVGSLPVRHRTAPEPSKTP